MIGMGSPDAGSHSWFRSGGTDCLVQSIAPGLDGRHGSLHPRESLLVQIAEVVWSWDVLLVQMVALGRLV